jgi:hypothetical protein
MTHLQLQSIISEMHLDIEVIAYLLKQGIEVENLRLEVLKSTNSESIESHIKIIQGEGFLSLLIAASAS